MANGTEFDFGYNEVRREGARTVTAKRTGPVVQPRYGQSSHSSTETNPGPVSESGDYWFFGVCSDALQVDAFDKTVWLHQNLMREELRRTAMDLTSYKSSKNGSGGTKFENRDWIESTDLPKKGSSKWKIDSFRPAKKGSKAIGYVDLTCGSKKRVMSLRKGFTLDAFIESVGANTDKWKGKTIDLERGGAEGQYVNVAQ